MKTSDNLTSYFVDLSEQIRSARLDEMDFDTLLTRLGELAALLEDYECMQAELRILREDYCLRISGMLKAIAVAGRKQDGLKLAEEQAETLGQVSADNLIALYRRTQAKFHDTFPSSFGGLNPTRHSKNQDPYRIFK